MKKNPHLFETKSDSQNQKKYGQKVQDDAESAHWEKLRKQKNLDEKIFKEANKEFIKWSQQRELELKIEQEKLFQENLRKSKIEAEGRKYIRDLKERVEGKQPIQQNQKFRLTENHLRNLRAAFLAISGGAAVFLAVGQVSQPAPPQAEQTQKYDLKNDKSKIKLNENIKYKSQNKQFLQQIQEKLAKNEEAQQPEVPKNDLMDKEKFSASGSNKHSLELTREEPAPAKAAESKTCQIQNEAQKQEIAARPAEIPDQILSDAPINREEKKLGKEIKQKIKKHKSSSTKNKKKKRNEKVAASSYDFKYF